MRTSWDPTEPSLENQCLSYFVVLKYLLLEYFYFYQNVLYVVGYFFLDEIELVSWKLLLVCPLLPL